MAVIICVPYLASLNLRSGSARAAFWGSVDHAFISS